MDEAHERQLDDQSVNSLLAAAREGCAQSRAELLEQLHAYLIYVAKNQLESELKPKLGASDVVQQSYAKAIHKFDKFRGTTPEELRGWLRQILVNEIKQQRRTFRAVKRDVGREQAIDLDSGQRPRELELTDGLPTPGTHAIAEEQSAVIQRAIARLPEQYQVVLDLRNWQRLSFKEVAKRMDKSVDAVTKLWYRALARLQEELESLQ